MKILLVFLVIALIFQNASADSSDEDVDIMTFGKMLVQLGWQEQKLELLADTIKGLADEDYNVTIVAWQNIYHPDGKLKEIHTIELVIPKSMFIDGELEEKKARPSNIEDDEDDTDIYEEMSEAKEVMDLMSQLGMHMEFSYEEYSKDGELVEEMFMDKDRIYLFEEGFGYLNQTKIATKKQIDDFIASKKDSALPIAVIRKDVDGNFIEAGSVLAPSALTSVNSIYEADNDMVEAGLTGFTIANFKHADSVPKNTALFMKQKYPDYYWHVTRDTEDFYISRDVSFTLQNEFIGFEDDYEPYTIFGFKKE